MSDLPSLAEIANDYKAQRNQLRRLLIDLLEAAKALREVVTHDCQESERVHMLEHFAPAVLAVSDVIATAEGDSALCVNQGEHCGHDECCVCGAKVEA